MKALRPHVQIINVEPQDSNCLAASIASGQRVVLPHVGIFADGVAVKQVGSLPFSLASRLVDDFMTVSTDQICYAMKGIFEETKSILEPAGVLALASMTFPLMSMRQPSVQGRILHSKSFSRLLREPFWVQERMRCSHCICPGSLEPCIPFAERW